MPRRKITIRASTEGIDQAIDSLLARKRRLLTTRSLIVLWNLQALERGFDKPPLGWQPDPVAISKLKSVDLRRPNCGAKSVADIIAWLRGFGLTLADLQGIARIAARNFQCRQPTPPSTFKDAA